MLFAGLLETLRRHGFAITVDHELRLQRLLPHLDVGCRGPADLRDILCPLFATTEAQQKAFGPILERWLRTAGVAAIEPPPPLKSEPAVVSKVAWYNRSLTYFCLAPLIVLTVAL